MLYFRTVAAAILIAILPGLSQAKSSTPLVPSGPNAASIRQLHESYSETPTEEPAATPPAAQAAPEAQTGSKAKTAVSAAHSMAVAANPYAVEAANAILAQGGSAVDAAIAAEMVLNVVEPQSSGIGGGGFLLAYDKASKQVHSYDGREKAPLLAKPGLFLNANNQPMDFESAMASGRSVGVPGLLRMLALAHKNHGKLPWADLFAPAILLASDGFALPDRLYMLLKDDKHVSNDTVIQLLGKPLASLKPGDLATNKALAATLQKIAASGADVFYNGQVPKAMVSAANAKNGNLQERDFAFYQAVERDALCGSYREHMVCSMGTPSAGGFALLQSLKLLEGFPCLPPPHKIRPACI